LSLSCHVRAAAARFSASSQERLNDLSVCRGTIGVMTLTTIITLNAVLGAAVVYALHHLLAHGIRSGHVERQELVALPERDVDRIAA
jgi:hypothetical protein